MKDNKMVRSEFVKAMMSPEIPVHRILPTIRSYGTGKKSYHLVMLKQYRRHNSFYRSHDKDRAYCLDATDEDSMKYLAKQFKKQIEQNTSAQVIITETHEEFLLHSKPKKVSAGHYIYRGYTIYDSSYVSKEWWVIKGENSLEFYDAKKHLSSPDLLGRYGTLKFAMENIDILIDRAAVKQNT